MIAINGKTVTGKTSQSTEMKIYHSAITQIKKKPFWTFDLHSSKITMPDVTQENSIREQSGGAFYPCLIPFIPHEDHDIGVFEVRWYESSRPGKGDQVIYAPRYYDFDKRKTLNSATHADEIFFLMCVIPGCETYEPMELYCNTKAAELVYCVIDAEADAEIENEIDDLETRFKALIFGDLALTDEKLRDLAAGFKIPNALDKELVGMAVIKKSLKNKILSRDHKHKINPKLIEEFLDLAGNNTVAKIKATIHNAGEKKIIATRMGNGVIKWLYLKPDGEDGTLLLEVMGGHDPEEKLIAHLASNEDVYDHLTELTSNKK